MNTNERVGILLILLGLFGLTVAFISQPEVGQGKIVYENIMGTWMVWPPLAIGFIGTGILYWYSRNRSLKFISTLAFVGFFSSYFFFYEIFGSDAGGILSIIMNRDGSNELSTLSGAARVWPAQYILIGAIQQFAGLTSTLSLKIIMLLIVLIVSFAFSNLFKDKMDPLPIMPVMIFLISSYIFLNWQPAPQVLAFGMFILYFSLPQRISQSNVIGIIFFTFIVFLHGFVAVWFLGVMIFYQLMERIKEPAHTERFTGERTLLTIVLTIELAFFIFYAPAYMHTFSNVIFSTFDPSDLTGTQSIPSYAGRGLFFGSEKDTFGILTKVVAISVVLITSIMILSGMARWKKSHSITRQEISLFSVGTIHLAIGSIFTVLGIRGFQPLGVSISRTASYLPLISRRISLIIVIVILSLLPANLIRINSDTTIYLDNQDLESVIWYNENGPIMVNDTGYIIGPGVIVSMLQKGNADWEIFQSRWPPPEVIPIVREHYFIDTPEYDREIEILEPTMRDRFNEMTEPFMDHGNLILDSGENQVYFYSNQ